MRLNINQLVYDEESETYVERTHKENLLGQRHYRPLDELDFHCPCWYTKIRHVRNERIDKQRSMERKFKYAMRENY